MSFINGYLNKRSLLVTILFIVGGVLAPVQAIASQSKEDSLQKITLQLQWYHQFQFAGYYAALEKGYYEEAGFDVTIKDGGYDEYGNAVSPEAEVVFNRAQFGTTRSDVLLGHSAGLPVVVVANIMQHSPYVFLTLEKYKLDRLEQIGYERAISLNLPAVSDGRVDAEAVASLKVAGVDISRLNNSFPTWDLADLTSGKSQLIPAYSTDQPYFLQKQGVKPVTIKPSNYGVDFYGDLLFTSQKMLRENPETVSAFRDASLKGWRYALDNPIEIAELIARKYKTRNESYDLEFLLYEANKVKELINSDVVEIGYINQQRWEKIAEIYQALGLIRVYDMSSFLYQPIPDSVWSAYVKWIKLLAIPLVVSLLVIVYLVTVTRKLKKEVELRRNAEKSLITQAEKDALTGIYNRHAFQREFTREFSRAKRYRQPFSVLIIDIDFFKAINDKFGHLAGDEVIRSLSRVTGKLLRASDLFARYGGEEFVIMLPNTIEAEAIALAERILKVNQQNTVTYEGDSIRYTISMGVTELWDQDENINDLFKRGDELLYEAKHAGRNCIRRYMGRSYTLQ
jgi:diguanylate cyclase (GGDEF)-like protein